MVQRRRLAALALLCANACTHSEPPTAKIDGSVSLLPIATAPPPSPSPLLSPSPSAAAIAAAGSAPPGASTTPPPNDIGEQTKDKPSVQSAAFQARMKSLWQAIADDEPPVARGAFFPVKAYEKVKAVGNPAGDWRVRLLAAYERDIHDLHLQLGTRASRARYVGIDVPEERGRWVEPGEEYNKLGYYRVFGSRLKYEVDGRERSFLVKSLISWRGEYYVVHLSGMK